MNAQIMGLLLNSMGVKCWEPRVVPQLLEFLHCYVSEVLLDGQDYAFHAGRSNIELADVRLAIESKLDKGTRPPGRQELIRIARRKNQSAIPPLPFKVAGVLLPPDEYCLTKDNYQVVSEMDNPPPRSLYQ
uniref:Bromodomain associated domain-containing protein n=1 Tax=Arcella intermedia TaxID=1963864 RepID=A0A6B2LQ22_9EUKA